MFRVPLMLLFIFIYISWTIQVAAVTLPLLAVFPSDSASLLGQALRRKMGEVENRLAKRNFTFLTSWVALPNDTEKVINESCQIIESVQPLLVLNFLNRPFSFFLSLIAGYTGIAEIGYALQYSDQASQDVNPFYISLDPSVTDLADAVFEFLLFCDWYDVVLVADDGEIGSTLVRYLRKRLNTPPWRPLTFISLQRTLEEREILGKLDKITEGYSRVILLYCDDVTTLRVLRIAEKLNLLSNKFIWIVLEDSVSFEQNHIGSYPSGLLAFRLRPMTVRPDDVLAAVNALERTLENVGTSPFEKDLGSVSFALSCSYPSNDEHNVFTREAHRSLKRELTSKRFLQGNTNSYNSNIFPVFDILNLVHSMGGWKVLGNVSASSVHLDTVLWLGAQRTASWPLGKQRFRVVTAFAPPFVQESTRVSSGSCLMGTPCLQVTTNRKEELVTIFADYAQGKSEGIRYNITCCAGITMDLLTDIARDLHFDYDLYLVSDGMFGTNRGKGWNGITADLISGAAHLTFSSYSVNSLTIQDVDFTVPYFHSGVSCLAPSKLHAVPLSAFLEPFSIQLWVAIFVSLNVTAIVAAIYEWVSPFGLNPWGRQRVKNFSLASALWVMWSLLFSHLVAFKAPKSWPNKVLINVWGCFSVIFLASYTAKYAALFAGLFFQLRVDDLYDSNLLNQRTSTVQGSAAEGYVFREYPRLWEHIKKYEVETIEDGLEKLRNGELDVLIGDTAVLNYYRGNERGCNLQLLGDPIFEDSYAVGMQQGFPLKDAISSLILQYNEAGYIDQLQQKWYGRVPCFEESVHGLTKPMGLSVRAVSGVFIMLSVGHLVAICTLILEHLIFRYLVPVVREKPKNTVWKSPHLMFFSQKLHRFINTVRLVSPHHSIKEIASNLKKGQIFSLFQKSVKRKAREDARKSKTKAQFFQLIQDIRNVVQEEHEKRTLASFDNTGIDTSVEMNPVNQILEDSSSAAQKRKRFKQTGLSSAESDSVNDPYVPIRKILLDSSQSKLLHKFPSSSLSQQESEYEPSSSSSRSSASSTSSLSRTHERVFSSSFNELFSLEIQNDPTDKKYYYLATTDERAWSFSDLRTLKTSVFKTNSEIMESEIPKECHYLSDAFSRRQKMSTKLCSKEHVEELKLYSMTKEEIISRWKASENELRSVLKQALRYNKELEEKLMFLQKTSITLQKLKKIQTFY
ncbi:glutamate receptor ionotropic, NMDA 3A-like [Tachypleus tridentatus]|uniref:glutamate receptor ionotropic, NMDA 3A-like n=1 Tax=Tachypleus tridentatus TaxID=6853 RepID=UPI003FD62FDE